MSTDSSDGNGGPADGAAPVRFVAAKRRNCTITQYCTYIAKGKPKLCDRRVLTGSASDFLKTVRSNGFSWLSGFQWKKPFVCTVRRIMFEIAIKCKVMRGRTVAYVRASHHPRRRKSTSAGGSIHICMSFEKS
ncbi:hypothetical protein [Burkholderia ubonensis]|uniref:hypothetical protein n=1 Tax=Burkholderia ubonensis TaxID=101571 RepID=UPI000AF01BE1|nr:hypothetical protein [Burkholderia ubonensis]